MPPKMDVFDLIRFIQLCVITTHAEKMKHLYRKLRQLDDTCNTFGLTFTIGFRPRLDSDDRGRIIHLDEETINSLVEARKKERKGIITTESMSAPKKEEKESDETPAKETDDGKVD